MNYFNIIALFLISMCANAVNFKLEPVKSLSNNGDDYELLVSHGQKKIKNGIPLEGNANYMSIDESFQLNG